MADYVSANGFVQWDPQTREANGQEVFEFSIKTPGTDGAIIRITVWPELQTETVLGVERGDFVAVDGKLNVGTYKAKSGEERSSIQINASRIAVLKGEVAEEREVVNTGKPSKDLF